MKKFGKQWLILSLLALAAAGCNGSPEAEKTKADAQAASGKVVDTARDVAVQSKIIIQEGAQKAGDIATNVAAKTWVIATNVAAKVKDVTTNVVGEVKAKFGDLTH